MSSPETVPASPSSAPPGDSLQVVRVSLDRLHPDPGNVRQHGAANLQAIQASLTRFGQAEPLIVQAGTGRVIAGHGRLEAMKALGWTECDVVELPVEGVDAAALGIALNRTAELADWDSEGLARILEQLRTEDALEGIGYGSHLRRLRRFARLRRIFAWCCVKTPSLAKGPPQRRMRGTL